MSMRLIKAEVDYTHDKKTKEFANCTVYKKYTYVDGYGKEFENKYLWDTCNIKDIDRMIIQCNNNL